MEKISFKIVMEVLRKEWVTILFALIFLVAWTLNAFKFAIFDLTQLISFYATIRGAILADYITDSTVNSPKGEHPYQATSKPPKGECSFTDDGA